MPGFQGFDQSQWPPRQFTKTYIMSGLQFADNATQNRVWRNWMAWLEPEIRAADLLEPEDRTVPDYRSTNQTKSTAIAKKWVQQFANDLNTNPSATDEWKLQAGKSLVSYLISEKRLRVKPDHEAKSEYGRMPVSEHSRLASASIAPSPAVYEGPVRPISELGIVVRRGRPDGSYWYAYSAATLKRPGIQKLESQLEIGDLSFTVLLELLKADDLMKDSNERLVTGLVETPKPIMNDRHFHDAIRYMQGQRRCENLFWILLPAAEGRISPDLRLSSHHLSKSPELNKEKPGPVSPKAQASEKKAPSSQGDSRAVGRAEGSQAKYGSGKAKLLSHQGQQPRTLSPRNNPFSEDDEDIIYPPSRRIRRTRRTGRSSSFDPDYNGSSEERSKIENKSASRSLIVTLKLSESLFSVKKITVNEDNAISDNESSIFTDDSEEEDNDDPEALQEKFIAMQNSPLCEQWDEDDWVRDCEIVGHPPNKTDQAVMVKIIGLEVTLYKHQLIAGFWMIFHERGECEGGWLADDMGLGKTFTKLFVCYFEMFLDITWHEIDMSRVKNSEIAHKHCRPSGGSYKQPNDAVCPSQQDLPFPCPCVETSHTSQLKPKRGPVLLIIPPGNISTWIDEIHKTFGKSGGNYKVKIVLIWNQAPSALKQYQFNRGRDYNDIVVGDDWKPQPGQTRVFCITTPQSCKKLMNENLSKTWVQITGKQRMGRKLNSQYGACHSRVIFDEAHGWKNATTDVMTFIRGLNGKFADLGNMNFGERPGFYNDDRPRKWFLSGTPIDTSPGDFIGSMSCLERPSWSKKDESPYYNCKSAFMERWGKAFMSYLNANDKGQQEKTIAEKRNELLEAEEYFPETLPLFLIRRTDKTLLFGEELLKLPDLHMKIVECTTPPPLKTKIQDIRTQIINDLAEEREKARRDWVKNGSLGAAPLLANKKVLTLTHRLRVLADLPGMVDLVRAQRLACTFNEAQKMKWWLNDEKSPWRKRVAEVCKGSGKVAFLENLLTRTLPSNEKLVCVTDFPIVAELLSLYIERVLHITVGFFHSKTKLGMRKALVDGFQEYLDPNNDNLAVPKYKQDFRPRVLIAVTGVIAVGFTLTMANNLVKFDICYSSGTDRQVYKRIHRIGQKRECTIWKFLQEDSPDEKAVMARAEKKSIFIDKAYELKPEDIEMPDAGVDA